MREASWQFCGEPLDPASPNVYEEVKGWTSPETEEFVKTGHTGRYAHGRCVAAREFASPPAAGGGAR
jgi:hypothetical protein